MMGMGGKGKMDGGKGMMGGGKGKMDGGKGKMDGGKGMMGGGKGKMDGGKGKMDGGKGKMDGGKGKGKKGKMMETGDPMTDMMGWAAQSMQKMWEHEMMAKGKAKGKGKAAIKIGLMGEPCFVGKLRTFDITRNAGTISCPEVYAQSNQEVYSHQSILEQKQVGVGDTIVFLVHWNTRGQPQCTNESLRINSVQGGMAMKGTFKAGADPEKGFGFIECPEAYEFFGRDVYVTKDLATGFTPGMNVAFNVKLNKDMQPNASEMILIDDSWQPLPGDLSVSKEDPNVKPPWEEGAASWGGKKKSPTVTSTGEFFTATFKAYNESNGWGFVGSDALQARFGADVFAHSRELTNVTPAIGTVIYFELGMTEEGKPQVMKAHPVGADGTPIVVPGGTEEPAAKKQRLDAAMGFAATA